MKADNTSFTIPGELVKRAQSITPETRSYRSEFSRDRDRILYSRAFRRLAGKTQIYRIGIDDHQRNRLTHTLEVAQIAKAVACALNLDDDLAEAIALGHDLGHTPFGHAGEQILHELMTPCKTAVEGSPLRRKAAGSKHDDLMLLYGFKHNVQSVRTAAVIEDNYGKYGLNLTNYTLWGILHHTNINYSIDSRRKTTNLVGYYEELKNLMQVNGGGNEAWSFEGLIVKCADEVAQIHHDMEDALLGSAMTTNDVNSAIRAFLEVMAIEETAPAIEDIPNTEYPDREYVTTISGIVINTLVTKLIDCSQFNLSQIKQVLGHRRVSETDFFRHYNINSTIGSGKIGEAIGFFKYAYCTKERVNLSQYSSENEIIKSSLSRMYATISEKIHHSMDVERMNTKGQYIIRKLFEAYYANPQQLPDGAIIHFMIDAKERNDEGILYSTPRDAIRVGIGKVRSDFEKLRNDPSKFNDKLKVLLMRRICDHIAGMTDRYAIFEYNNLY